MPTSVEHWSQAKLNDLSLEEKIALSAGSDIWRTVPLPKKNVPYIKTTDGPAGARGGGDFNNSTPSTLFPSPSCLGSTWDVALAKDMGHFIGLDAHEKLCHVVLGPTINMQRDPRAGRYFESYSEDPHLTGRLGCGWVAGCQNSVPGMAATMKHFVGNEAETDRRHSSSNVSQEALREVYLEPFREIMAGLVRQGHQAYRGQPACVMTAYNRINGISASENEWTINEILRKEWGFGGLVMSDWFALHAPGLQVTDLEMPGPALHRKMPDLLSKVDVDKQDTRDAIDRCAKNVLKLIHDVGPLGYTENPEMEREKSVDVNAVGPTIRQIGAEGAVLLKNKEKVLPIVPRKGLKIACIGSPWVDAVQSGGGSANLTPQKVLQPLKTLRDALHETGVTIEHHRGCDIHNFLPGLAASTYVTYYSGRSPGQGELIGTQTIEGANMSTWHPRPDGLQANNWWAHAKVELDRCSIPGHHRFGLIALGNLTVKASSTPENHSPVTWDYTGEQDLFEYFLNPARVWGEYHLPMSQDERVVLEIDYVPLQLDDTIKHTLAGGFQVGFELEKDEDQEISNAAELAKSADIALILSALGKDWESEGFDRSTMHLPRKQDQLITAVSKVQPRSVLLNITGSPIETPWLQQLAGFVQVWYGGQEGAESLVDILLSRGEAPASGRLASTWPARIEDHPSGRDPANFPGVAGDGGPHVTYSEGRLLGYKYYNTTQDAHRPNYYFGQGIGGYTSFKTELVAVEGLDAFLHGHTSPLIVSIKSTNLGDRSGKDVAQLYVRRKNRVKSEYEPVQKLAGFATLRTKAGQSTTEKIALYQETFSFWDETHRRWRVEQGDFELVLAQSADLEQQHLGHHIIHIPESWEWEGIGV